MSLKGLFRKNEENDTLLHKIEAIEKRIKKMNTLEVHLKRFLQWEQEFAPLLKEQAGLKRRPAKEVRINELELEKRIFLSVLRELEPLFYHMKSLDKEIVALKGTQERKGKRRLPKMVLVRQAPLDSGKQAVESLALRLEMMEQMLVEMRQQVEIQHNRMDENEERLRSQQDTCDGREKRKENPGLTPPPVIIQEYKIEKVVVDKYEVNNHIAQLGIKELGGQLNIGATYGVGTPPVMGSGAPCEEEEHSETENKNYDDTSEGPETETECSAPFEGREADAGEQDSK
ncbi:hypothetical protein D1B31_18955 [Neobacillus notoginsengisoli]|uniref:Uncharacterized protein n=1 Tax=Neobacillus notoginsengisoli TaxID=1578198 RepID=A0A417YPG6_9BACI|nr:hypothetical protein [Neobacillus notoginsengisoli]RHW35722.1 hypothetical protein D1B31_18955 [Neobacillus notoginsengisoli]